MWPGLSVFQHPAEGEDPLAGQGVAVALGGGRPQFTRVGSRSQVLSVLRPPYAAGPPASCWVRRNPLTQIGGSQRAECESPSEEQLTQQKPANPAESSCARAPSDRSGDRIRACEPSCTYSAGYLLTWEAQSFLYLGALPQCILWRRAPSDCQGGQECSGCYSRGGVTSLFCKVRV